MKKRLTLISLSEGGTLSDKNGAEIDAKNWNDIAKQFYSDPYDQDKREYKFEVKPVENAIALGKNASAFADNVIAIGKGAISGFESAVSIGENADTEGKNSVAIGKNSKIFGESSVAIGEGSRTGKIKYVIKTIKGKDTVEKTEEFDTIEAAKQELEKKKDLSKIYRIEIGGKESENSVAIGKGSAVEYKGSVAIGADSLAVESNGKSAFTEVDHTSGETVSFGNSNKKRRLTNVADGKDSSDAVTVAQLQKAIADNKGGSGGSAVDSKVSVEGGEGIKVTSANNKYTVALADGLKTKIDGALQSDEADGKYAKLDGSNITEANWVGKLGDASIENGTKLAKSSAVKTYVDTEINNISTKVSSKLSSDDVDVKVTFPEEYQAKELAGKPAMFKVTIKEIKVKEYPKVDDEFAQEVSEFDTLAEYKADIKKDLVAKKKEAAAAEKESKVIEEIVKNSEMDIPEKMIEAQAQQMVEEFAQNIAMQGISFDQYMQFTGSTVEQLLEQVKPQAKARIESSLVLEEVVKAEKIEATDEEFEKELEDMATRYQMEKEKVAELLSDDDKKNLRNDICLKKAAKFVTSKAK